MLLFVYYSITLDNTDISTSGKGKTPVFTNNVKIYSKEALSDEIHRLTIANVQLMIDKIETEKTSVNLKTNKMQLLDKKNFLVVKRKELRVEIVALNVANVLIRSH